MEQVIYLDTGKWGKKRTRERKLWCSSEGEEEGEEGTNDVGSGGGERMSHGTSSRLYTITSQCPLPRTRSLGEGVRDGGRGGEGGSE